MKFYTRRRASPVITIVSLIDILTVVLIFFVFTTTFKTQQPQIQINLPEAKSAVAASTDTPPVLLSIDPSGAAYLDGKPIELEALGDAVKKVQSENRQLAMQADKDVPFGKMLAVLDVLKVAGVPDLPTYTKDRK